MHSTLKEHLSFNQANIVTESSDDGKGGKSLYMKGIFIEGDVRNQNNRIYPATEIHSAVKAIMEKIKGGYSVLGEADHPDDLNINLDRVSHMITEMDIDGNPSAPDAYPDPIYERIMNHKRGNVLMDVASASKHDDRAQRYLQEEVTQFIENLRYRRD